MQFIKTLVPILIAFPLFAHDSDQHEWKPTRYSDAEAHAPTPLPDRVVLTWAADPATTQSVTWRTDASVHRGIAQIAIANDNGRALKTRDVEATTTDFTSDLNKAHYHTLTFADLQPDTQYAYRVGDGENWSEYFQFRTASAEPAPFTFVYFGDAQNDVKTHWSRVFREAFRSAPRAAFTLHAGDLINEDASDAEWGEWHGAPAWVNATVPIVATPGNHEYYRANPGPKNERFWNAKDGREVALDVSFEETDAGGYRLTGRAAKGMAGTIDIDDDDKILAASGKLFSELGYAENELLGSEFDKAPLRDRLRERGTPTVSRHWRPQFAFPVQNPPEGTEETCYYMDYQGTRIISLDSSVRREEQIAWLRRVLEDNPQRWTIITFHHPIFSPARDRDNRELRELWKPILDEYKVDLVLNGHDHTYARTGFVDTKVSGTNFPSGYQQAYDPEIGTVYVVSVSGPKMYPITKGDFAVRTAEDTQLYQVISVDHDELHYEARTATGVLYDMFTLEKRAGAPNRLHEALPPENRRPQVK
ncbi:fibronectin type III domain-containing protein [Pelagicoccus sp. SDUM812002]|uniref:fibronectin type III domain-containing protein n=1 Tax=Pelagicoccus sp. SDUM812002 TaxID=3041266 RepID=UPI0028105CEA|nr:fibronectin type III domain-containing protein [Pelagicoccus sp. SDUM812002]MDQ8188025.1 fibronectin type III domain-containing protein [Pelagicoccus sp. SDUM812002]